ncbi:MAG TPA: NADPH-dependent FMN reductase [Bacteroidota bacterium]|nr:NADPH-dependent FMN reductase [Bacteroidota bacterium]
MKIAVLIGSIRRNSYNRMLYNEISKKDLGGIEFYDVDISKLPLFNQDIEENAPQEVLDFSRSIRQADGVLFITAEYNYSIPGVLKNAIDWGSRQLGEKKHPFFEKPVGIMSASMGIFGGVRAQLHLRQVCVFLNTFTMPQPEFILPSAHEKFNSNGILIDEFSNRMLDKFLSSFIDWVEKFKK